MTFSPIHFNASFIDMGFLNHILQFFVCLTPVQTVTVTLYVCFYMHVQLGGGGAMRIMPYFSYDESSSIKDYLFFNFQICKHTYMHTHRWIQRGRESYKYILSLKHLIFLLWKEMESKLGSANYFSYLSSQRFPYFYRVASLQTKEETCELLGYYRTRNNSSQRGSVVCGWQFTTWCSCVICTHGKKHQLCLLSVFAWVSGYQHNLLTAWNTAFQVDISALFLKE